MIENLKKLFSNPLIEYIKIIPKIKRDSHKFSKTVFDYIGIDYFSRPYPNHDELIKYLKNIKNGFYVECGGYDGYFQDPTYNLEKFKRWTGIIIEPVPLMYELCKKNRTKSEVYCYAAGPRIEENTRLKLLNVGPMSIIKDAKLDYEDWASGAEKILSLNRQEIDVTCLTLDNIIDNHFKKFGTRKINLLVIDVEGYELELLNGFTLEKYLPHFILIEIIDIKREHSVDMIFNKYYSLRKVFQNSDYLYELKDEYR